MRQSTKCRRSPAVEAGPSDGKCPERRVVFDGTSERRVPRECQIRAEFDVAVHENTGLAHSVSAPDPPYDVGSRGEEARWMQK